MRIPELILLIGIPAAGKSTFAREQLFDTHVRLNLDMLRTRVKEMRLLEACLKSRISCMVDNTNITRAGRARSIPLAKTARFRVTGYCLETSLETALRQNLQRERHVPNYAMEQGTTIRNSQRWRKSSTNCIAYSCRMEALLCRRSQLDQCEHRTYAPRSLCYAAWF